MLSFVTRCCEMFKREEDFDICGEAENGRDAIEREQQLRPDLIVLRPVDARDEWPRRDPYLETFDAEGTVDYVQRFR